MLVSKVVSSFCCNFDPVLALGGWLTCQGLEVCLEWGFSPFTPLYWDLSTFLRTILGLGSNCPVYSMTDGT